MKLGASTYMFGDRPLAAALDFFQDLELDTVEIATGGYVGDDHCRPADLLHDRGQLARFARDIESRGLTISAFSCHGNPLHPEQTIAERHHRQFRESVRLAAELGVETVVSFSGCPGSDEHARAPSFACVFWPEDFANVNEWQWRERLIPYWTDEAEFCARQGVKIAIEPHPGFTVYNPSTLLKLRAAVGEQVGANFDPSHLFWQGIDIAEAARSLAGTILHVHAKDTGMNAPVARRDGVLDVKPFTREHERAWIFRTVGYGHGVEVWRDLVTQLQLGGYDGTLSFEYEDTLVEAEESCRKAIRVLRDAVVGGTSGTVWTWRYSDQTQVGALEPRPQ